MRNVLTVVVFAAVVAQLAAQGPIVPPPKTPPSNTTFRDTEVSLTVGGCIRGTTLRPDRSLYKVELDFVGASQFDLQGPKELLRNLLRDHDGHEEEITGIAIIPGSRTVDGEIKSKELGKGTRITASAGSAGGQATEGFRPVRLKVQRARHVNDKCRIPGA